MNENLPVIIIRLETGEDIIAFLNSQTEEGIHVDHPFYARFDINRNQLMMVPYCPLSDEVTYFLHDSKVDFLANPKELIVTKYMQIINSIEAEEPPASNIVVEGNVTKH